MKMFTHPSFKTITGTICGVALFGLGIFGPSWAYLASQQHFLVKAESSPAAPGQQTANTDEKALEALAALFHQRDVPFPPATAVLTSIRRENTLDLFAPAKDGSMRFIHSFETHYDRPVIREGFYRTDEDGYLTNAVRSRSNPETGRNTTHAPVLVKQPAITRLSTLLPDGRLRLIAVNRDGRLAPILRRETTPGSVVEELQASLARLPIPPTRWKAVLAEN